MKTFTEKLKYEWNLAPESVVIDAGCFEGNWSHEIWKRYGCRIYAFEPIRSFYWDCLVNLSQFGVAVLPFGLGAAPQLTDFGKHGCMSGAFADDSDRVDVEVIGIESFLVSQRIQTVGLLKLNIEGMEFELLEYMIQTGLIKRVSNLLVQPHTCVPDSASRWKAIQDGLSKTHECVFHEDWVWSGYSLRK